MKKTALAITTILCTLGLYANKPDYGYLFSYVNGRGIAFAYSSDSLHNPWQGAAGQEEVVPCTQSHQPACRLWLINVFVRI